MKSKAPSDRQRLVEDQNKPTAEILALRPLALWRSFKEERAAFILISIYLVLEYVKPDQAYPIFGVLPFIRLSLLGAMAACVFDRKSKLRMSAMTALLLVFLAQCVISAIYAYQPSYAYENLNVVFLWVVVYILITNIVTTERRLFLFFLVYLLANLKMAQFGFFTWVHRGFGFASWGITGTSWFKNSGEFGLEMAMYFAYTASFIVFLRRYWQGWVKWLMYFLPVAALGCVIASSSRGAIISVAAAMVYFSLFSRRKVQAWIACSIAGGAAFFLMPPEFTERFRAAGTDTTSLARIEYWSRAEEMMREHPFLGVGYYNWIPYYRDHFFDPTTRWVVEQVHNTYLQIGAELGYVGLGIFVLMVALAFITNWRSATRCQAPGFEFLRSLAIGMNAAGLALVAGSMFLTSFFMPNYWIHFALTVCLSRVVSMKSAATHVLRTHRAKLDSESVTPNRNLREI